MNELPPVDRDRASKGGVARAKSLSASRRSEIGREGALTRWDANLPKALCDGWIEIAGRSIACAVLDTKLRVLTQETFLIAVGRAGKAKGGKGSERMAHVGGLPPFLAATNLDTFISDDLRRAATPILFRTIRGNRAYGYDAKLLPLVCEVYLLARDAHLQALKDAQEARGRGQNIEARSVLLPSQERIVQGCDLLMRDMAKEHIVTLVDRATGYDELEVRDNLTKILEQYIAPHLMPYVRMFPDEFFRQVYRIHGWKYEIGNNKRPQYVGKFINKYIYGLMPEGVLEKLKELNPVTESGHRRYPHVRLLTNTGNVHLDRQITSTVTIMTLSEDAKHFDQNFWYVHRRTLEQNQPKRLVVKHSESVDQLQLFPSPRQGEAASSTE